ncbi:MAG: response regulator [Polyangiaceae bacterium]
MNRGRPTVWIVDDSPLDAEFIRRTLAPLYHVEVFSDGAAVIEHLACGQSPDAIILDWQMPGISGVDVCQFLRTHAQTRALPILVLTVLHDTHDLVKCLAAGADDFLSKPHKPAELSARIGALIRSKQLHERVQNAERAVRALLMDLPDAVMSIDGAGRVSFVNAQAERMLSKDSGSLLGKALGDVLPEFPVPGELSATEGAATLPDLVLGDRIFAPAIRRNVGIDANETTISFRHVTSERQHEKERARLLSAEKEARAQAEIASRAKDEFLAVVSHELRTPLNAILGWTRMLQGETLDPGRRERALVTIERNASAQQRLIEDLLDISRITSGKLQMQSGPVLLATPVQAAVEAVHLAAQAKSIDVVVEAKADVIVSGDSYRLQQIVWNLLSNAVKFTPPGGSVHVTVGSDGQAGFVSIRDTGEGISRKFLPYIFARFRQADSGTTRAHGGLGLGLAIVQHLVNMQGGTVAAQSDGPGTGSTFTVAFPLVRQDAQQSEQSPLALASRSREGARLGGTRVLVVDDDADARELMAELLRSCGAEASSVSSAVQALTAVQAFHPHVVVSDIGMPMNDGYFFVRRLRALSAAEGGTTPAIALTAYAGPGDRTRALEAGFSAHVCKPVDLSELVAVITGLTQEFRGSAHG